MTCSCARIRVLEHLPENEDGDENTSAVAGRLGITRSNFTRIAGRLVQKGLPEKQPRAFSLKQKPP